MNSSTFKESLACNEPPLHLTIHLKALWYDAKGDWEKAHRMVQAIEDNPGTSQDEKGRWIHAYLHRKEGDIFNADYWYRRAGKKRPGNTLQQEWDEIVDAMLTNTG